MSNNQSNSKRIVKNTIALCFRMLITMAIGIYTSRIVLQSLGVNDFGVYNLVGGIVSMFSFLNTSMLDATQRYLNFYLGKNDYVKLNEVFGTSLTIFALLALVIFILCETIGLYFLYYKLSIPDDRLSAAFWVLQFSAISSLINISSVPYNALVVSYEKMATFAYVSVYQSLAILLVTLSLNFFPFDRLIIYGLLVMFVHISIRLFYRYYCSSRFNNIRYKFCASKLMFKELLSFSGWTLSSTFAYMTYNQGINIMMNMFYGPVVNAAQALASQINGNLNMFSNNFTIASKPQITKYYAEGQMQEMKKLVYLSSKVTFFIFLAIALPFFIRSHYILSLWLHEVPQYTDSFLKIFLLVALVGTLSAPIITAVQATGRIKYFQLTVTLISLMILPLAYIMNLIFNEPIYTYYVILLMTIIMQLGRLYFFKNQLGCSLQEYFKDIIFRLLLVAVLSYLLLIGIIQFFDNNLWGFILVCIFSCTLVIALSLFIGFNKIERTQIISTIKNKIK